MSACSAHDPLSAPHLCSAVGEARWWKQPVLFVGLGLACMAMRDEIGFASTANIVVPLLIPTAFATDAGAPTATTG